MFLKRNRFALSKGSMCHREVLSFDLERLYFYAYVYDSENLNSG